MFKTHRTDIEGVLIIEPAIFADSRGHFCELFQQMRYEEVGISNSFVQDNLSRSRRGVLRGLHLQNPSPQGKLVMAVSGEILDVAVDVRIGSPTFGRHVAVKLSGDNRLQLWIPRGFAHGFVVRSDSADFLYKCDEYYSPSNEIVIRWDDPDLRIDWGLLAPELSKRDAEGLPLSAVGDKLIRFKP